MAVVTLVICENRERFAIEEGMEFSTRGIRSKHLQLNLGIPLF